jgi:glycosyltransferase involved in cell wall biosynthesis
MTDGETGWLVPPRDAAALAAAMKELLSDPLRAAELALAARERVEEGFSARRQAGAYAALYRGRAGAGR